MLTVIYTAVQWSFDRGMLDYVNKRELASLQLLSKNLARYYQQEKDWSPLIKTNKSRRPPPRKHDLLAPPQNQLEKFGPSRTWHQIVKFSDNGIELPADVAQYLRENGEPKSKNRKPPRFSGPPHQPKPRTKQQKPPPPSDRLQHPSLLNAQKEILIGKFHKDFSLQSIQLNGIVIGYLALPPKTKLTDAFDLAFLAKTKADLFYIVLVLFLVIIIIAVPISNHFVMPIKYLEKAMRALNSGDFKANINVRGNDELASLSLNFNDLAKTLEQNENSRNTWLANISHELRTPIAIIKGEIEAIQDGIRALDFDSLSSLNDEVNHLHKLVNDLSTLSNAEIGAMRYQKSSLSLSEIVKLNVIRHNHQACDLDITLHQNIANSELKIFADKTRINQLIDNLINNSLKYTQAPGAIYLSLTKQSSQAVLIISDTLPGVSDDALPKLFEHLYRVESSRNRKTGGSGLGLALCKKIMSAHQGTIEALHSEHGGLQIRCTFPLLN